MSVAFEQKLYDDLKGEFEGIAKTVFNYETRELPRDPTEKAKRIETYKTTLVEKYNNFVTYICKLYPTFDENSKIKVTEKITQYRLKLLRAFTALGLKTDLPEQKFGIVELCNVIDIDTEETENSHIFVTGDSLLNQKVSATNREGSRKQDATASVEKSSGEITENNSIELPTKETMPLSLEAILSGITDFSSQSQPQVVQFLANADMVHTLAPGQADVVLTVIRARLATATALGDISNKTWAEIKRAVTERYIRADIPFETAQERLLSIKQSPKEDIEAYASRTKKLLDILNASTINAIAAIQEAQRAMNESLAVRKFKQNIFGEKVRLMAMNIEHSRLADAIAHAYQKTEELKSSNIEKDEHTNASNSIIVKKP